MQTLLLLGMNAHECARLLLDALHPHAMNVHESLNRPPHAPRVETCWALLGPSRRPLTCAIYRTDVGLEVRVGYGEYFHLCARRAKELAIARTTARELREAVNSSGVFEELYDA